VVGTFGRGFYVLDDYSALRHTAEASESTGGFLCPVADAFQFRNSIGSRGSRGAGSWIAPNPPYGAVFSIYLKSDGVDDPAEERAGYRVVIRDADGTEINSLPVRSQQGLQRIVWDLRAQPPEAEEGGRRGRGREVEPGFYTARLEWDTRGRVHYFIGEEQTFQVRALDILP